MQCPDFAAAASTLRRSHPKAPAVDGLDLAMQGHEGSAVELTGKWLAPGSPFGQVVATALDRGMQPEEWRAWTQPPADTVLQAAMLEIWRDVVMPAFVARYRLAP